jgi:hypothetical protein
MTHTYLTHHLYAVYDTHLFNPPPLYDTHLLNPPLAPIKKMDIWAAPDVLILQLKRFQYIPGKWVATYIHTYIHTPPLSPTLSHSLPLSYHSPIHAYTHISQPPIYYLLPTNSPLSTHTHTHTHTHKQHTHTHTHPQASTSCTERRSTT